MKRTVLAFLVASAALLPAPSSGAPRGQGTVTGILRYKGCLTGVPGATVTVIGRDRVVKSDSGGRFLVDLQPGTYSLVIRGPSLVPDQRVDDVPVTAGKLLDLGIVEVWADERPAICVPDAAAAALTGGLEPTVASAPDLPAVDLPGNAVAPSTASHEHVVVRGPPGSGPGQFGLQGNPAHDDEDALGPPSFAVTPQGGLLVLDVLNGRVQRFDARGRFAGAFPVGRPGAEPVFESDLAVSDEGTILVVSEGEVPTLTQYDASGKVVLSGALPPSFKGIDQILPGRRPTFLMLNGQSVRAELGWGGIRAEGPRPGLPAGDVYVQVEKAGRWSALVRFVAADGKVRRTVNLRSAVPVARIRLVGVNRRGDVVLAIDRHDGGDDEDTTRAEVMLVSLTQQGQIAGTVVVPPGDRRWLFREFALASDGSVVQMQSDVGEVRLVRWPLPSSPKDGPVGEGLLRGRLLDGPRPAAGGSVLVSRGHRVVATAPVGPDGSFEVRVPAGPCLLGFRRGPAGAAGGAEPSVAELRVAVPTGATVDVGTVQLTAPRQPPPAIPQHEPNP